MRWSGPAAQWWLFPGMATAAAELSMVEAGRSGNAY